MKSLKQIEMFTKPKNQFGGSLLVGKRKSERTLAFKRPMHLVLKGDITISGSLLKHRKTIDGQIKNLAEKFFVKVYSYAIEKTHIHFAVKFNDKENYRRFIRALTGRLAQLLKIKFIFRPYTKIIEWGRQLQRVLKYVIQNHEEATGARVYKPRTPSYRKTKHKKLRSSNTVLYTHKPQAL